ncbi:MAG: hypothetical protein IH984_10455 [Planctomycetes bacterium]|nr:hypothetical protein [Planctomycetota bacterium]
MDNFPVEMLWRGAIAVIPIAILVAVICRFAPCKASTRHMLWLIVLMLFAAVPVLPRVPVPQFSSVVSSLQGYFITEADLHEIAEVDLPKIKKQQETDVVAPDNAIAFEKVKLPSKENGLSASSNKIELLATRPILEAIENNAEKVDTKAETKDSSQVQVFVSEKMPDQNQAPGDPQLGAPILPAIAPTSLKPKSPGVGWSTSKIVDEPAAVNVTPLELAVAPKLEKIDEPVKRSAFATATIAQWNRWTAYFSDIRNAIMGLPPLPAFLWIGGAIILLLVSATKVARSNRLIKNSRLAPPSVVNMVAAAAGQLELKRAPLTLITDQPISPMLWCGRRVYLILPRELWAQLDDVGRKAVIYHELAHLHRRDHWVCWFEMIIGWLYWWNPVVWWVRKRIREEADLCCDAWVTVLMPTSRREYAQALLDARKCTSISQIAGPCMGLGVSTKRAKRFARRLTMVMTEHAAPRLSVRGLTLALALAVGGCIVTPLWACPPSESAAKKERVNIKFALKEHLDKKLHQNSEAQSDEHGTTFEKFMQSRGGENVKQRIEQLQHQIKQLKKELANIHKAPHADHANPFHPELHAPKHDAPHAQLDLGPNHRFEELKLPKAPRPPRLPKAPRALKALKAPGIAVAPRIHVLEGDFPAAVIAQGGPGRIAFAPAQSDCNKVFTKKYKLSAGILKDLTALMVRSDVPIIVSPHDDYIEVHANQAQHMIFSAFTKMIGSDKERKVEYELSAGKLEALTKLMSRSDVPIIIEPDDDEITVHGNALEQAIFGAFVKMISQRSKVTTVGSASRFGYVDGRAGDWAVLAEELRGAAGKLRYAQEGEWAAIAEKMQEKASKVFRENSGNWAVAVQRYQEAAEKAYSGQMKKWAEAAKIYELKAGKVYQGDLKKILGSLEGQIKLSTEHATRMATEAMRVAEMAEMLEGEIEEIVEAALEEIEDDNDSKGSKNQRKSIERMIKKLIKQIKALKLEAEAIEAEAEVIEEEAELLREQAEQVEETLTQAKETEEIVASNGR